VSVVEMQATGLQKLSRKVKRLEGQSKTRRATAISKTRATRVRASVRRPAWTAWTVTGFVFGKQVSCVP